MIEKIIQNNRIEITPNYIFKYIILFGVILFISGFALGYALSTHIIYERLLNLIENNGVLIFNNNHYIFHEIKI